MADTVAALLDKLSLSKYNETFEDEAITDVSLLISMGADMLRENLEELGLDADAIELLASELFPDEDEEVSCQSLFQIACLHCASAPCEEPCFTRPLASSLSLSLSQLLMEDNDTTAPPAAQPPAAPKPSVAGPLLHSAPIDALPDDLTQEEIDAAEAEAQWLLNPLSMIDLSETKERLLKMMAEGISFQQRGQHANARSVFTRALAMEAPNKRMNASLYYNRSACQRELGQLQLALRDAQKAAELEPTFVKAHWRAADVAIVLADEDEAMLSIEAGLKVQPRCQPLLALKLKIKRFE